MNDSNQQYSASEAATMLLRAYRNHREDFHILDDFDDFTSTGRAAEEECLKDVREPLQGIARRLGTICRDGFFLTQVCEWKIDYLAEALLHAIEVGNPLSLASNTRGLIEHVAALTFVVHTLEKLKESLDGQGSEVKINDALSKAELTLKRAYFGKSPKTAPKEDCAPHIEGECLAALELHVKNIREVYDFLCDYVHPNFGSNQLVSSGQLGAGQLNPPVEFHQDTTDRFCRCCSLTMIFLRDQIPQQSACLMHLADFRERCVGKGAKVGNAFSERSAVPEGDGKSKETAFFFRKARTAAEAIGMTYDYLEKSGSTITGDRVNAGVEGDFIYDVFPTSNGQLWFKIPMTKP